MTYLYRLYDESGALLYVGIATGLGHRFDEHQKKPWFPDVLTVRLERFASREDALAAEKAAIAAESPPHNVIYSKVSYFDRLQPTSRPRRTQCPQGHPYDEANTYVSPKGQQICRMCKNLALDRRGYR